MEKELLWKRNFYGKGTFVEQKFLLKRNFWEKMLFMENVPQRELKKKKKLESVLACRLLTKCLLWKKYPWLWSTLRYKNYGVIHFVVSNVNKPTYIIYVCIFIRCVSSIDSFEIIFDYFLTHIARYLSHNLTNVGF